MMSHLKTTNLNVPLILGQIAITGLLVYQNKTSSTNNVGYKEEISTLASNLQEVKEERAKIIEKLKDLTSQLQVVKDERENIREKLIDIKDVLKNTTLPTPRSRGDVLEAISSSDHNLINTLTTTCVKTLTIMAFAGAVKYTFKNIITTAVLENFLPPYVLKTLTAIGYREPVVKTFQTDAKSEIGDFTVIAKVTDDVLTSLSVLPHGEQFFCGITALSFYLKNYRKTGQQTHNDKIDKTTPNETQTTLSDETEGSADAPLTLNNTEGGSGVETLLTDVNQLLGLPEDYPDY